MTTPLRWFSDGGTEEGQSRAPPDDEKAADTELGRGMSPASVEVPAAKNMLSRVRSADVAVERFSALANTPPPRALPESGKSHGRGPTCG